MAVLETGSQKRILRSTGREIIIVNLYLEQKTKLFQNLHDNS